MFITSRSVTSRSVEPRSVEPRSVGPRAVGSRLAGVAIAGLLAAAGARAQEVQLFHDKGFWSQQLAAVGEAAKADVGVGIEEVPYANAEQYKAFIQSSIASGETPELFTWWTGATFAELVGTGEIAPLDDVWKELVDSGRFAASAQQLFLVDGKPYAVPLLLARWVVLYDKPLHAELGLKEPTSWDELEANAAALKQAGHTPFLATVQEGWRGFIWFQELMLRMHPEAYDGLNDGSVAYDGPEVRDVFAKWVEMYANGWFSDPRSEEEVNDYVRGDGAMYLAGEWSVGLLEKAGVAADDIGVFIMPNAAGVKASAVIVEGSPLVVSTKGKEDPDVMKAVRFWTSDAGADVWGAQSGNYIGNDEATAPNAVVAEVNEDISTSGATAYLRWWEAVPSDLQGELVAEMNRFMLDPADGTAKDVMANMQALNAAYWADR